MKLTNLEYVQSILSSLGSDEVNSVSDTTESLQVLECVRQAYFNILARSDLTEHTQLITLNPSLDINVPVLMYVPSGVDRIDWIKYFNSSVSQDDVGTFQHSLNTDIVQGSGTTITSPFGYDYVQILPFREFIDMTSGFNPSNSNVESFTFTDTKNNYPGTYTIYYKNNKQPQFCTVLSDYYVIFDGYDSNIESTLQNSKVMAFGEIVPTWSNTDNFIPNIDEDQVPLLLGEAKSLAFYEMKQMLHQKAEQENKRQWSSLQKDKSVVNKPSYFDQLANFGRVGNYGYVSYFKTRGWNR